MATHFKVGDYIAFGTHSGSVYEVESIWGKDKGVPHVIRTVGFLVNGEFNLIASDSILFNERHNSDEPDQWKNIGWDCVNHLINFEFMNHPNLHVINKVKSMIAKRKAKGYAF